MPRNVRNFWVELSIDGRENNLSGGPAAKDGGIGGRILIRQNGEVATAVSITGAASRDGTLYLRITPGDGMDFRAAPNGSIIIETRRDPLKVVKAKAKPLAPAHDHVALPLCQLSAAAKQRGLFSL
jgi:hypothetical protein